ncbi:hypothetical protein Zmor_011301 [Zophobas morio]|uniref:Ubiquinone biosynthesis O-methyltransferase, mitochondrial n=1 Tax=Zophobas morio TaxID=2755281 RepID=A0AA38ITC1_9CUCU|nr:hypothetical protein Zmor_011301 [Zophobas morio]
MLSLKLPKLNLLLRTLSTKKSTVDPKQMEYFNEISEVWWDKQGVLKILHEMNDLRIPWIQNRLREIDILKPNSNQAKPLEGLTILDVGCGGGILTEPLCQLGAKVTGIDPNTKLLNIAKSRALQFNLTDLEYYCTTVEEHAEKHSNKYDVVTCFETIEHVREQDILTKFCVQCLKPGGSIFLTTNSKSWTSKLVFITLLEDLLRFFPSGTHQYEMFIDINDLINLLEKENCKVLFTKGMSYNPFSSKWTLVKNVNILNYVLHAVKFRS